MGLSQKAQMKVVHYRTSGEIEMPKKHPINVKAAMRQKVLSLAIKGLGMADTNVRTHFEAQDGAFSQQP